MPLNAQETCQQVRRLVSPLAVELGLEVFDVEFVNEGGWMLRVFIDRPEGVSLDDCEAISQQLGDALDVEDLIPRRYQLEVSSPGVNRKIRDLDDFRALQGTMARVKLTEDVMNTRLHIGRIERIEGDEKLVLVERDRCIEIEIPTALIDWARVEYEWE